MTKIAPINSTTIIPESKGKLGGSDDTDQRLTNDSVDDAKANIQDIILNHRLYNFSNNPTTIIELFRLEQSLFKLAKSRNINGITLRGILSNQEERRVTIDNQSSSSESTGGIFSRIIPR